MDAASSILNDVFYLSFVLIILSSIIGVFVKMRSRDRCLRSFDGFHVTLELRDGKLIWGRLKVYGSGFELVYLEPHRDLDGHFENSFILYNSELSSVRVIYRYHNDLTPENQKKREKAIRRTYRPTLIHVLRRKIRNFFNTFRDALVQSLNLFIGKVGTKKAGAVVKKQKDITQLGGQIIGVVSNAYDPILEHYIGQYVVLEIQRGETVEEYYGILKEYTDRFIEVLNVRSKEHIDVTLADEQCRRELNPLKVHRDGSRVRVENTGCDPVYLEKIRGAGFERDMRVLIDAGKSAEWTLSEADAAPGEIVCIFTLVRKVDILAPRDIATVRHGGIRHKLDLETLLGFETRASREAMDAIIGG